MTSDMGGRREGRKITPAYGSRQLFLLLLRVSVILCESSVRLSNIDIADFVYRSLIRGALLISNALRTGALPFHPRPLYSRFLVSALYVLRLHYRCRHRYVRYLLK